MPIAALLLFSAFLSLPVSADIEVVQSVPLETTLAVPGVRQAQEVWLEMINAAKTSIDLEQFYVSDQVGEALQPVLQAIQAAAKRGVHVRLLVDAKFYSQYPESVNQIGQTVNCEARKIDFSVYGGVQHSKYFIVDAQQAFVGSQNFDWRALSHIHEIGVRVSDAKVDSDLQSIFEKDWAAASGVAASVSSSPVAFFSALVSDLGSAVDFFVTASPAQANPAGIPDTLTQVETLLASAKQSVRVQVMEYTTSVYGGGGKTWKDLDNAIRATAKRGVHVQLMVDVSSLKSGSKDLSALARLPNVEVMTITIPQWSGGSIPYARLIHSKYMVVDGNVGWVGSENWSGSYFTGTRNVGVVIHAQQQVTQLNQIFDQVWNSSYGTRM